ncbi:MAG: DNA-directed RNA polymerase subunit alpha [Deltaproteobacteria bacterium]|jgi:DNA-directed RNA polymerase subunit alpha|uniref:DNA-directed RNA polymerase subunit alpha n=1 Tax=Candidatus Acidulodesulfobacterium acidiphilum TaxID=2597224 RepID=A0A520XCN7_9DELT|nr:DNA-directed RNA polymerase subunit alpha [Deltaproteobacteria bacterium]MCL6120057.1 DNA-directed RNA polymerase subunit alpha [Deltaproteobacteria bacterium]MDA8299899.1 DNA-directed RNA polymerase subunit alpha [Deltaproteobacteria bacterium]RZV38969.1 MAG: DNA-directed RNA polymerase subunit alpha [Candidatus Acidulodesulfobacterium acidiphilum]
MKKNWLSLIKPKKIEFDKDTYTDYYGKMIVEPLERGFGTTIGNSLRRILLSSIIGYKIVEIKIEGISHEFSSVPGIVEDVTEIILNLKDIDFNMDSEEPETVYIDADKEGEVFASDIKTPHNVQVVNGDKKILTISKGGRFQAQMLVSGGRGYVPSELNSREEAPIGTISLDVSFSPVKKVTMDVSYARVGGITDYDKLIMEIFTNGYITPEDALRSAATILQDQISVFSLFGELDHMPNERKILPETEKINESNLNENLLKSVEELELSVRSANCLKNANIKTIGELVQKTEGEMLRTKNFGRKSLNEIKEVLSTMGLGFGMKVDIPANIAKKDK